LPSNVGADKGRLVAVDPCLEPSEEQAAESD
jgi:hypothetical protein